MINHWLKWSVSLVLTVAVALVLPEDLGWPIRGIAGWDIALVALLMPPWQVILRSDAELTRRRAALEDPGKLVVFAITLIAAAVSLLTTVVLLRNPEASAPAGGVGWLIGLGIVAVAGSWILVHTAFTLHYAHLYYQEDGDPGGLEFPDAQAPDDLDFAYFAFTIGMTFQTSDVAVSDRHLRHVVLGHALLSFIFNTAILALAVNLLVDRL